MKRLLTKSTLSSISALQNQENLKEYYTRLTNTLREYINGRFGFNAMEMTSSEIIECLQSAGDQKMIDELRETLQNCRSGKVCQV